MKISSFENLLKNLNVKESVKNNLNVKESLIEKLNTKNKKIILSIYKKSNRSNLI